MTSGIMVVLLYIETDISVNMSDSITYCLIAISLKINIFYDFVAGQA